MPGEQTPLSMLVGRILDREGGIKDVGDGKGVTRWGQTPDWLKQNKLPIPKTREEAGINYLTWIHAIGLTPIFIYGDDLADILLDIAVMSSAPKAVMALQASMKISVDGIFGSVTLSTLKSWDRRQLSREVIAWDMSYQGRLITAEPEKRAKYAAGWSNRMAGHVRRLV